MKAFRIIKSLLRLIMNSDLEYGVKRLAALAKLIGRTNCYDCDPTWEIEMNLLSKQLMRQHNISEDKLAYMVTDVLEGKTHSRRDGKSPRLQFLNSILQTTCL